MSQTVKPIHHQYLIAYEEILQQIGNIDPVLYGKTRNYINGAVTRLSPYISRGVISTRQVFELIRKKGFEVHQMEPFVKELAWRDYFQRKGQHRTEELIQERPEEGIPSSVLLAATGITGVDKGIRELYNRGYMHNHVRMYTASLVCNVAGAHWAPAAKWMYYHLLDADFASNASSWRWVAGIDSSKKYYANQDNINKYCGTAQRGTFLDVSYEDIGNLGLPDVLKEKSFPELISVLPEADSWQHNPQLPTLIYNFYNMDPLWHKEEKANRVLLLEPSHFERFPVSVNSLSFLLKLKENIPGIRVHVGEWEDLKARCGTSEMVFKEHPLFKHYQGRQESRDWMVNEVDDYFPSFFSYWKRIEKYLN